MVNPIVTMLAFLTGVLVFLLPSLLAASLPIKWRTKVGRFYFDLARRSYGHMAIVRRRLGGYEIKAMSMHEERPTAEVKLTGGIISSSRTIEFEDPDNRMKRWGKMRTAIVPESVPAVVSPELCEVAHCFDEKKHEDGLVKSASSPDQQGTVDPYIPIPTGARVIDPADVRKLLSKATDPDDIQYSATMTKRRFAEYKSGVGAAEAASALIGFGAGIGGVMGMQYIQQEVISNGGGGGSPSGPTVPIVINAAETLQSVPIADIATMVIP